MLSANQMKVLQLAHPHFAKSSFLSNRFLSNSRRSKTNQLGAELSGTLLTFSPEIII